MSSVFEPSSASVWESHDDPVVVGQASIAAVIEAARAAPNGRARLLLHADRDSLLHEMVIALPADSCDHPHINFRSGKSFLALSGRFAVMCFSDDGSQITAHVLSSSAPGPFAVHLRKPMWHTIIPLEGDVVFLETIAGPFTGNYFAEWFPSDGKAEAKREWRERLRRIAIDSA